MRPAFRSRAPAELKRGWQIVSLETDEGVLHVATGDTGLELIEDRLGGPHRVLKRLAGQNPLPSCASNDNRVIAFTRNDGTTRELVVASLNNRPFDDGYVIQSSAERLSPGAWQEAFNSDSRFYGGSDLGNFGAALPSQDGRIEMQLPANGLVVLRRI